MVTVDDTHGVPMPVAPRLASPFEVDPIPDVLDELDRAVAAKSVVKAATSIERAVPPAPMVARSSVQPGSVSAVPVLRSSLPPAVLATHHVSSHRALARAQLTFIEHLTAAHSLFLASRRGEPPSRSRSPQAIAPATQPSPERAPEASWQPGLRSPTGPSFDRDALEQHAVGRLVAAFGPTFVDVDALPRRLRVPAVGFRLFDRVLGIDATPRSLGIGTVWTETEVRWDSWFLHEGRMPMTLVTEASQSQILLASYLGLDLATQGERVYRLLGWEMTAHGPPPRGGEVLTLELTCDGHAVFGERRLFLFHGDGYVGGERRLSIRRGQGTFASREELTTSPGGSWEMSQFTPCSSPRLAAMPAGCPRRSFSAEQLRGLTEGRASECFGAGFERADTHARTPRIPGGRLALIETVTDFDPVGGPWGRGYLRAVSAMTLHAWALRAHFAGDPCMPGTLMLEGCAQAMSFYLLAAGFGLPRDAHVFELAQGETYRIELRREAGPDSREIVYEVFVEELVAEPNPTLFAAVRCTIDGRQALFCRRYGMTLAPGTRLDARPDLHALAKSIQGPHETLDPQVEADVFTLHGMLECSLGRLPGAHGRLYADLVPARIPAPPLMFMSRVVELQGRLGSRERRAAVRAEFDVEPSAWYFRENHARVMPLIALLEVALQPPGWLLSYLGFPLDIAGVSRVRNLEGEATLRREVVPDEGVISIDVTMTNTSIVSGSQLSQFEIAVMSRHGTVAKLRTTTGYFAEGLLVQTGLPEDAAAAEALAQPSNVRIDLGDRDRPAMGGRPRLPGPFLCMMNHIDLASPVGGRAGLGRYRGRRQIRATDWCFSAHFPDDPVQPGSLGLDTLAQLLMFAMLDLGMGEHHPSARFAWLLDRALVWKYRGQMLPHHGEAVYAIDVTERGHDALGPYVVGTGSMWVDGVRIYEVAGLGVRIVADTLPRPEPERLDPSVDLWLRDYAPTWTTPMLPAMSMLDRLVDACTEDGFLVVAVRNFRVLQWLPLLGPTELSVDVVRDDRSSRATLRAKDQPIAVAEIELAMSWQVAPAPFPPARGDAVALPYETGQLFHGPAFQQLRRWVLGSGEASGVVSARSPTIPFGALNQGLLETLTHVIPHTALGAWAGDSRRTVDRMGILSAIPILRLYGQAPADGEVEIEARFLGWEADGLARIHLRASHRDKVWLDMVLLEELVPLAPIGDVAPELRRSFVRDHAFVPGVGLSTFTETSTTLEASVVRALDWIPDQVHQLYGTPSVEEIAKRDHVAQLLGVHPRDAFEAVPLHRFALDVSSSEPGRTTVTGQVPLDLDRVVEAWRRRTGIDHPWLFGDLFAALLRRFTRHVVVDAPAGAKRRWIEPVMFLANHQVGVESPLFAAAFAALSPIPVRFLARRELPWHWLGRFIAGWSEYPSANRQPPDVQLDRADPGAHLVAAERLRQQLASGFSVLIHVEGEYARRANEPISRLSSVFIDLAVESETLIVPLRFVGGLPRDPVSTLLEFPVGMGRQDYWIGRPIEPNDLRSLAYADRRRAIVEAIQGLANGQDEPIAGDPAFEWRVRDAQTEFGVSLEQAVLIAVLREIPNPCDDVSFVLHRSDRAEGPIRDYLRAYRERLFARGPSGDSGHY